jgi:hypothetical protein
LWRTCGIVKRSPAFHSGCGKDRLNVENSVESVERFAILPQDMGLFSPFCPGFSPYFGVRP